MPNLKGYNNRGGAPMELILDSDENDAGQNILTFRMKDYDTGEDLSVEMIVDDPSVWSTFIDDLRDLGYVG